MPKKRNSRLLHLGYPYMYTDILQLNHNYNGKRHAKIEVRTGMMYPNHHKSSQYSFALLSTLSCKKLCILTHQVFLKLSMKFSNRDAFTRLLICFEIKLVSNCLWSWLWRAYKHVCGPSHFWISHILCLFLFNCTNTPFVSLCFTHNQSINQSINLPTYLSIIRFSTLCCWLHLIEYLLSACTWDSLLLKLSPTTKSLSVLS